MGIVTEQEVFVEGFAIPKGTATASSGAVTLHKKAGVITSEALTTAQNALYTLTLTNKKITASSIVLATVQNGTNTQGTPMITKITPAAGSVVIIIANKHASAEALNGSIKVAFIVVDTV